MEENSESRTDCVKFHLAEYSSLHGEIRELITESRTLERQVLFATGAVWVWLATNDDYVPYIAWLIPLLFSSGGYIRATLLQGQVDRIASYLVTIEENLCPTECCWHGSKIPSGIRLSSYVFWCLLILVTIVVPVVLKIQAF